MYVFNAAIFLQAKVENMLGLDRHQWPQQTTRVTEILLGCCELLINGWATVCACGLCFFLEYYQGFHYVLK